MAVDAGRASRLRVGHGRVRPRTDLLAGLATGLGSALAFFARRTNVRLLAQSLAFSAA